MKKTIVGLSLLLWLSVSVSVSARGNDSLWALHDLLKSNRFVDLTHAFHDDIPHWKGFPKAVTVDTRTFEEDGFWAQVYSHVGQWGTHVDPPAHFHKGLRTVDEIPVEEMLLPLVVIDVHKESAQNPDYMLTKKRLIRWESKNGKIPEGAFVAMRTDWAKRWPSAERMANRDAKGVMHYPGWGMDALKFLYEERKITASGHETTDTDGGLKVSKDNYEGEVYILGRDHYQIELLANLDEVPETGALVMVTWPKPEKGSGFPARVVAIAPGE